MNRMKIPAIATGLFFCVAGVFAADNVNEKGIEYYRAELYDAAKIYLSNQVSKTSGQDKAEAYYYLGECHAATEKPDSAAFYYQKATSTDPEYPYAYIGEGKLALIKNNQQAASEYFKKAIGFAKKNPAIHTAVAEAYIDAKQYDKASETLDKARSLNKNFSGIYVAEGDMLMSQGKTGEACAKYENAILFDKTDKVAYLKEARVYKKINPDLALERLNNLIQVDPDYIPAYAELGEINYKTGFYGQAIEAYAKFIEIPGVPIKHQVNYASLLFFTKEYAKSLIEIRKILDQDPNNVVMHRLQAYNNYEMQEYQQGLQHMEQFFSLIPKDQIITLDYVYYGRLLDKNNQPELAVENLKKALEMKDAKSDVYKELATAYSNNKNFIEAVKIYKQYFEKEPNAALLDIYSSGVASYYAAGQVLAEQAQQAATDKVVNVEADSLLRLNYLMQADSVFMQVIERSPNSYLGYYWRGNCNALLDKDATQGLAKPFYEKALEVMLANNADGRRNKEIIDCYLYLGFYYYVQEDIETSKSFYEKILVISPDHAKAKEVLDALKELKK